MELPKKLASRDTIVGVNAAISSLAQWTNSVALINVDKAEFEKFNNSKIDKSMDDSQIKVRITPKNVKINYLNEFASEYSVEREPIRELKRSIDLICQST